MDEIAKANEQLWEKLVEEGCGYTLPWLNLKREILKKYAGGQLQSVPCQLAEVYPPGVLAEGDGKQILCLASGGGQQSAVFGLLGAEVTVVDLAQGQLDSDIKAAEHYGYDVKTINNSSATFKQQFCHNPAVFGIGEIF